MKAIAYETCEQYLAAYVAECEAKEASTGSVLWAACKETASCILNGFQALRSFDAEPVVRCRDCVYFETGKDYTPYCNHLQGLGAPISDAYCSYGERKNVK